MSPPPSNLPPPNPQPASEPQAATDDPRSRTRRSVSPGSAPSLAPRISLGWTPAATRAYKKLRADSTLENAEGAVLPWPLANTLAAAMRAALKQTLGQSAPGALSQAPLYPALREQIGKRQSRHLPYGLEIQVGIFDDETIHQANAHYRSKDKPTDVLSFSPWEGFEFPTAPDEPYLVLGDVVISVETAARQARELKHDLRAEFAFLAVHGALHLLGYDHDSDARRRKMFVLQDEIVARVREDKGF